MPRVSAVGGCEILRDTQCRDSPAAEKRAAVESNVARYLAVCALVLSASLQRDSISGRIQGVLAACEQSQRCLLGDSHLHLDRGVDGNGGDLLHDLSSGVQIDDALVDAHLEAVPGLGTLTARRLARGDVQHLGGQADGTSHLALQALVLGATLQVSAHCTTEK